MPAAAKKYHVRFEERTLSFSESYPVGLEEVLPVSEFDSVVRKINSDMAQQIQSRAHNMRVWGSAWLGLCILGIGIFLTPVLFVKSKHQRKELKEFWEHVRGYFAEVNRKTYFKRNLEWKLSEDQRKLRGRDVLNPMLAYRIEIIHRIPKTRPKSGRLSMAMTAVAAGAIREGTASTTDTFTGSTSTSSRSSLRPQSSALSPAELEGKNELLEEQEEDEAAEEELDEEEQGEEIEIDEDVTEFDELLLEDEAEHEDDDLVLPSTFSNVPEDTMGRLSAGADDSHEGESSQRRASRVRFTDNQDG